MELSQNCQSLEIGYQILETADKGHHKQLKSLITQHPEYINFQATDENGDILTPLFLVIRNAENESTLLFNIIKSGCVDDIIKFLLENGANLDINMRPPYQQSYTIRDYINDDDDLLHLFKEIDEKMYPNKGVHEGEL